MDNLSLDYLTATRRKLHAMAELSGVEYNTSAFIFDELKKFGYKPKRIGTGVYADVGRGSGRIALRADIDALPICENVRATGMEKWSANGVMHACGHDGHTANLLNVARILGGKSDAPVRFIFQFGEEDTGGSLAMIEGGVLDGVDEIYALHLCPELDIGKIGYCYGGMFAGCCEFDINVVGKKSHCAYPELGADAVKASVRIAQAAYDIAKKHGLPLNLGSIGGGSARNIVADDCKSCFSLRFYDTVKCEAAIMEIERAAYETDKELGTRHDFKTLAVYTPLINSAVAVDRVRALMGDKCVAVQPRYTAEDFSNYLEHVTGCMVWLGTKSDGHDSPLHSDTFSFEERALLTGTELFLSLISSAPARGK